MGLYCHLDVEKDWGFPTTSLFLGLDLNYSAFIKAFAEETYDKMIELVPVDTGYLRSSLRYDCDATSLTFFTDCEYAEYVEYGTYRQKAQPYFAPAIEEMMPLLFQAIAKVYSILSSSDAMGEFKIEYTKQEAEELEKMREEGTFEYKAPDIDTINNLGGIQNQNQFGSLFTDNYGHIMPWSQQDANPDQWRPGTVMYKLALQKQQEKAQYFDRNGNLKPQYRAVQQERHNYNMTQKLAADKVSTDTLKRDSAQLSLTIGAITVANAMLNGVNFIEASLMGLVVSCLFQLLAITIIQALMGDIREEASHISFYMPQILIT